MVECQLLFFANNFNTFFCTLNKNKETFIIGLYTYLVSHTPAIILLKKEKKTSKRKICKRIKKLYNILMRSNINNTKIYTETYLNTIVDKFRLKNIKALRFHPLFVYRKQFIKKNIIFHLLSRNALPGSPQ